MEEKHLALISVSDKTGVVDFARGLMEIPGWEILSTGGTAVKLREGGITVTEVADYTGHRECLNGRIKTLNPKLFAGILAVSTPEHEATLTELGYRRIDLVVVNLYPFEQTIAKPGVTPEEAIEQIDIGGPSMIRAAAKNHEQVVVVVNPLDYLWVLDLLRSGRPISLEDRRVLAQTVFKTTAQYDAMINEYFLQLTAS
jgi:phosphoribosylaminoimidazolecarboxamide formyltransferase/IMP cyclohydrolase